MGNACEAQNTGDKEAQSLSRKIDMALMKDGKEVSEEIKILLLGAFTFSLGTLELLFIILSFKGLVNRVKLLSQNK